MLHGGPLAILAADGEEGCFGIRNFQRVGVSGFSPRKGPDAPIQSVRSSNNDTLRLTPLQEPSLRTDFVVDPPFCKSPGQQSLGPQYFPEPSRTNLAPLPSEGHFYGRPFSASLVEPRVLMSRMMAAGKHPLQAALDSSELRVGTPRRLVKPIRQAPRAAVI